MIYHTAYLNHKWFMNRYNVTFLSLTRLCTASLSECAEMFWTYNSFCEFTLLQYICMLYHPIHTLKCVFARLFRISYTSIQLIWISDNASVWHDSTLAVITILHLVLIVTDKIMICCAVIQRINILTRIGISYSYLYNCTESYGQLLILFYCTNAQIVSML